MPLWLAVAKWKCNLATFGAIFQGKTLFLANGDIQKNCAIHLLRVDCYHNNWSKASKLSPIDLQVIVKWKNLVQTFSFTDVCEVPRWVRKGTEQNWRGRKGKKVSKRLRDVPSWTLDPCTQSKNHTTTPNALGCPLDEHTPFKKLKSPLLQKEKKKKRKEEGEKGPLCTFSIQFNVCICYSKK